MTQQGCNTNYTCITRTIYNIISKKRYVYLKDINQQQHHFKKITLFQTCFFHQTCWPMPCVSVMFFPTQRLKALEPEANRQVTCRVGVHHGHCVGGVAREPGKKSSGGHGFFCVEKNGTFFWEKTWRIKQQKFRTNQKNAHKHGRIWEKLEQNEQIAWGSFNAFSC